MRKFLRRALSTLVIAVLIAFAIIYTLQIYPRRVKHPELKLAEGTLFIRHARIYTTPTAAPIEDGAVVITNGRITAVGPTSSITIPANATEVPCDHCILTAGFWNAHVHFTEPKWTGAEWQKSDKLNSQLADMFLARGFTTVIDVGSNPADTLAIRRRTEQWDLKGPYFYTAEMAIYPPHGIPFYLDNVPKWIRLMMLQPDTPEQAQKDVRNNISNGADLTKLFTGSYVAHGVVKPMPLDIATAAVNQTHSQGKLVFAHPSDLAGTRVAIESGVDVLAHAPDTTDGITPALFTDMVNRKMCMTPTLKMFATTVTTKPSYLDPIYAEVREFHRQGGTLIFGTDVGYMTDYTTEGEFEGLAKSGLDFRDVLAMLTTNPSNRMGVSADKGTIEPGKLADLTLLSADPATALTNFSTVTTVIRSGRVIWTK